MNDFLKSMVVASMLVGCASQPDASVTLDTDSATDPALPAVLKDNDADRALFQKMAGSYLNKCFVIESIERHAGDPRSPGATTDDSAKYLCPTVNDNLGRGFEEYLAMSWEFRGEGARVHYGNGGLIGRQADCDEDCLTVYHGWFMAAHKFRRDGKQVYLQTFALDITTGAMTLVLDIKMRELRKGETVSREPTADQIAELKRRYDGCSKLRSKNIYGDDPVPASVQKMFDDAASVCFSWNNDDLVTEFKDAADKTLTLLSGIAAAELNGRGEIWGTHIDQIGYLEGTKLNTYVHDGGTYTSGVIRAEGTDLSIWYDLEL